jgi:Zn-dependent protease with chaperone function
MAAGSALIISSPMLLTLLFGTGLSGLGLIVLIFLLRFVTRSNKTDLSGFLEVQRADEPQLFHMIDQIARRVGTSKPKKLYLSAEVNASVFYDSNFWSMFLPVKKNLQIGLGLLNSVSKSELTAILAHEFGHFSQKTMKVGSYVYQVNHIIFKLLNNDTSYHQIVQRWARVRYFSLFVFIAVRITQGIQWILAKLYPVVNKNFLGLSREMEFQADEIAARIAGSEPMRDALLRLPFAEYALNYTLHFYEGKIADRLKSENLYRDQEDVMTYIAGTNNYPVTNGLPKIPIEDENRFDQSKLTVKNPWSSHPQTKERIDRLEMLNIPAGQEKDERANAIFSDIDRVQRTLTTVLFDRVQYEGEVTILPFESFQAAYRQDFLENVAPAVYNGYYVDKDPVGFETETPESLVVPQGADEKVLFSDEAVNEVYKAMALKKDIEALEDISGRTTPIKTFDYDGIKYRKEDSGELILVLKAELKKAEDAILAHDRVIFAYFSRMAREQNKSGKLEEVRRDFFESAQTKDQGYELCHHLTTRMQFVEENHTFEQIRNNLLEIKPLEEKLRTEVKKMLKTDSKYHAVITPETRESLEIYVSRDWEYFDGSRYFEDHLKILFSAISGYVQALSEGHFRFKRKLLEYQEALIKDTK